MNNKYFVLILLILLSAFYVSAENYVLTGNKDFSVYIDPNPELSGSKVYATVSIDQGSYPGDAKCVDMIVYKNGSTYLPVQSNPTLASSGGVNLRIGSVTPEERGYFDINDGIGTIYFRTDNFIPYNNFTIVVLCNVNGTSLVYEEAVNPVWRQAFKSLPSRGVWFGQQGNADMIVLVGVVVILVLLFVYYKVARR
jgi:hypothetical protein